MEHEVLRHMYRIIDDHFQEKALNDILKSFIVEIEHKNKAWSDIVLCTHYMLGGNSPQIYRFAAATELVILSSDILDDLQDQDQINKPWMQCSHATALNAVLAFFVGFIGELGEHAIHAKTFSEISKIIARSINGQHKDLYNTTSTVDDYLTLTREKSGSIFKLACFMGCFSLQCSKELVEQINDLADCIGIIHQIQSDISDLLQYQLKSDLHLKRRTLPAIYLLSTNSNPYNPLREFYKGNLPLEHLIKNEQEYIEAVHSSGCMEYAQVVQAVCIQTAEDIWRKLQARSPWKENFRETTYASFIR